MTNFSFMFIIVSLIILFIFKLVLLYLGCAGFSLLQRPFSSCGSAGYSLVVVQGLLIAVASLVAGHGL